jgi:hypothetical protein
MVAHSVCIPIDDYYLTASLDDTWRTALTIRRRIKKSCWDPCHVVDALRRLASDGLIERSEQPTGGIRQHGGFGYRREKRPITLELFRKRQESR